MSGRDVCVVIIQPHLAQGDDRFVGLEGAEMGARISRVLLSRNRREMRNAEMPPQAPPRLESVGNFVSSRTAFMVCPIRLASTPTRSRSAPGSSPAVISTTVTWLPKVA